MSLPASAVTAKGARGRELHTASVVATHYSAAFDQQAIAALGVTLAGLEARLSRRAGAGQPACPGPSLGPPDAAALVKAWVGRQVYCRPIASLFCHPNPSPQARAPPVPSFSHRFHSPPRPPSPAQPLACVLRQVELSFMMGPGSGQVRRLLLALQEAGSAGRDGAAAAALNAGWTPSARDAQVGEIYLSELERLGQLHVREEWLREQLA